jgi:hypothetical protein
MVAEGHTMGALSISVIVQYLPLRARLIDVQLDPDISDGMIWKWTASGMYSVSSAYAAFFQVKQHWVVPKRCGRSKHRASTNSFFG